MKCNVFFLSSIVNGPKRVKKANFNVVMFAAVPLFVVEK